MSSSPSGNDPVERTEDDRDRGIDPEEPAAGVDDVIEFFDREPPEHPVTDADAPPPFG